MVKIVRPFKSGNSQAIRIPKELRFREDQALIIRKEGNRIILEPKEEWPAELLQILGQGDSALPRPKQRPLSKVKTPFS